MRAICLLLLVLFGGLGQFAAAEEAPLYECHCEVGYQWRKPGEEAAQETKVKAIYSKEADEPKARGALERAKIAAAQEAMEICRARHESFSSCLAAKLDSHSAVLQRLGFSARTKLEEAIELDCKASQGECLGVKVSEPACVAPAQPNDAPADSKDGGKKEAKGAKK